MKTALQEIFEYWDTQNNPLVILNWIASNEKRLLEKEKEQMLSFGLYVKKNGWVGCKIEEMYEDYINQNK